MSKEIPLSKGMSALVDDDDYTRLSAFSWYCIRSGNSFYAARYGGKKGGSHHIWMHRVILDAPKGFEVDHINGNKLDNRRENLRIATRAQNAFNRAKFKIPSSSRFKGVTFHKRDKKWQACIKVNGRSIFLGYFKNEVDAARAYNEAAAEYFGEFANLNDMEEKQCQRT